MKAIRIFVVEDSLSDVLLIQEAINLQGISGQLQVASQGDKALKELSAMEGSDLPSLIVIDLNLPRVDGFEVLRHVRGNAKFANTAVLVLTSSKSPQDRLAAEQLGANAFVTKPLTLDDFNAVVGGFIARLASGPSSRLKCGPVKREARRAYPSRSAPRHECRQFEARRCGWVPAPRPAGF